ncbi:hypothetical protein IAR55_004341 [Kwoniella newhampshirensis]|uniref:TAFII55 protein conserved region domain-containing protein n=1 Tax=Kwoniella newhampshirensis TaxID=1651941 RepID=A0AAW0YN71_9TREE
MDGNGDLLPSSSYSSAEAGPSALPFSSQAYYPDRSTGQPSSYPHDEGSTSQQPLSAPVSDEMLVVDRPLSGPGSRGGRGRGRGFGRGRGSGRGSRRGRGSRGGGMRTSTRISERAAYSGSGYGERKVQKLKLSFKTASGAAGGEKSGARKTSFLGEYDRELDENTDEPLCFEEQFILRVPKEIAEGKGEGTGTGLRDMVKGKGKGLEGVEFKFLDPRRAAFKFNGVTYAAKLVDLPNIIESQKTFDNRHLFKVADISQMLVVDQPVTNEASITAAPLKIDEYIWPHGITPPMRWARKRRFRKRLSRRAIEVVEESVEELLNRDKDAEDHSIELIDAHPDPEIADEYYINYDPEAMWQQHGEDGSEFGGSEMYEDPGSVAQDWGEGGDEYGTDMGDEGGEGEYEDDEGEDGDGTLDQELAAALMEDMDGSDGSGQSEDDEDALSGSDDDEDDDEGEKSEDDDETIEKKAKIKQFNSEIKALEGAIEKKRAGFAGGNPIMMKRFEETIAGLQADVSAKIAARQALVDELDKTEGSAAKADAGDGDEETPGGTPMDEDADMDDAEGEYEDGGTPAAGREGRDASIQSSEGDDDLFGEDEEDEGEERGTEGDGEVAEEDDEEGYDDEDGEGEEEEEEEEDEMSRMLRQELEGLDQAEVDETPATPGAQEQADAAAAAALNDFAMAEDYSAFAAAAAGVDGDGTEEMDVSAGDMNVFGDLANLSMGDGAGVGFEQPAWVEGGAGRRRYARGVEAGSDDSSDESDD